MIYEQKCSRCGKLMKRLPIKRLDSKIIIEYYCKDCDESLTYYPDYDGFIFKKPKSKFLNKKKFKDITRNDISTWSSWLDE